jgi:signal transduction histidine kinase
MADSLPWLLLAALAATVLALLARLAGHLRWLRRTLAGADAGRAPSDAVARLMGLGPVLAAVESRARAEEEIRRGHERRLGELLARLTQSVVVVDAQDRLRLANPAARRLFRLDEGAEGASFVPMARSAELVDLIRRVRRDGGAGGTLALSRAPESDTWIRVEAAPASGEGAGEGSVILVAEDITQLRRLQSVEREFLANLSHDLRTPVTILRGYAETLAQDMRSLDEEGRERFAGKIAGAARRLGDLLEGMLALATLESDASVRPAEGALAAAAEDAVEALAERARAQGTELVADIADRAGSTDPIHSRRVAQNLIENALHHAKGAGRVVVRVEGETISVTDDGPGVGEADLGRLFDRLYRADRSRRQGGAGLGLSIVRQVAELHGGWTRAEGVEPRGLRITARLGPDPKRTAPA